MGYVLVGYVLNGYVWDMCGVRYANNLLKNPATKRLSGKELEILILASQLSVQNLWSHHYYNTIQYFFLHIKNEQRASFF